MRVLWPLDVHHKFVKVGESLISWTTVGLYASSQSGLKMQLVTLLAPSVLAHVTARLAQDTGHRTQDTRHKTQVHFRENLHSEFSLKLASIILFSWRIKINSMSLAILFHFLCSQHVSDINVSIIRSLRLFCWITTLLVLFLVRCVLEFRCGWVGVVSVLHASGWMQPEACNTDTTPTQPHRNSNTHRTKNNTSNVVIQQNSRKLLMMG